MKSIFYLFLFFYAGACFSQTGIGVGLYPTGTESGIGIRTSKEKRWIIDARLAKANIYSERSKTSTCITELAIVYRIVKLERVMFHIGIGHKGDWNFSDANRHGITVPIGVEAFPFPFQNAGLFFETAFFAVMDPHQNYYSGLRTAGGIVFYFLRQPKPAPVNENH
jgi:hypothetical protein